MRSDSKKRLSKRQRELLHTRSLRRKRKDQLTENEARKLEVLDGRLGERSRPPRSQTAELQALQSGALMPTDARAPESQAITSADIDPESVLSPHEREILRMVNVERVDVGEVAAVLNEAQGTQAWDDRRVCETLARARAKLTRHGQLEAARPAEYATADARARYDSIVRGLRHELAKLPEDNPMFGGARSKVLKTIAEVERMRDEAIAALGGKPGQGASAAAIVYVSALRDGPLASAPARARAIAAESGPIPPTPPPGG